MKCQPLGWSRADTRRTHWGEHITVPWELCQAVASMSKTVGSTAGVTRLSKVWPSEPRGGGVCLPPRLGTRDLCTATLGSPQQARRAAVPALDPAAVLRDVGCLGPSFTSSGTSWGSGPRVWVALEPGSWRPCARQFQIGRIQPCVLVLNNPAKKDTARTNYPECGLGRGQRHLPVSTQSSPPPPCPPARAPVSNFPETSTTNR